MLCYGTNIIDVFEKMQDSCKLNVVIESVLCKWVKVINPEV